MAAVYLKVVEIGGVMWCHAHAGVVDECSDTGEHCDMADADIPADFRSPCDFRNLYIAATEEP